jgi:hypothetical protein
MVDEGLVIRVVVVGVSRTFVVEVHFVFLDGLVFVGVS